MKKIISLSLIIFGLIASANFVSASIYTNNYYDSLGNFLCTELVNDPMSHFTGGKRIIGHPPLGYCRGAVGGKSVEEEIKEMVEENNKRFQQDLDNVRYLTDLLINSIPLPKPVDAEKEFDPNQFCWDNYGYHSYFDSVKINCSCESDYWIWDGKCKSPFFICLSVLGNNGDYSKSANQCTCLEGYELKENPPRCEKISRQTTSNLSNLKKLVEGITAKPPSESKIITDTKIKSPQESKVNNDNQPIQEEIKKETNEIPAPEEKITTNKPSVLKSMLSGMWGFFKNIFKIW